MSDRSRRRKLFFRSIKGLGVLVLLILLMLWLSGAFLGKAKPGPPVSKPKPPPFSSTKVVLREFPLIAEQVGTVVLAVRAYSNAIIGQPAQPGLQGLQVI